jgi:phosphoribosylcarboxyaminoimidazole (NCAIR) mutase
MMVSILFLGMGSPSDPDFDVAKCKEQMKKDQIIVLDKVIESCHGCPDIMSDYSMQMQALVNSGDRVVAVLEGGLLFGLPSIQATQTTYPIISLPLDKVAYTAFMVPTGHAVISGVGVDNKTETIQKQKAIELARRMLLMEGTSVTVIDDTKTEPEGSKLEKELQKMKIDINNGTTQPLTLVNGIYRFDRTSGAGLVIRADTDENMNEWDYFNRAELRHHDEHFNYVPTAQVKGVGNLALYAAKILSLQRPELRDVLTYFPKKEEDIKIMGIKEKKRASYQRRDLIEEVKTLRKEMNL